MIKELEIRGLRVEKFIQKISNIDFVENERYIFNCIENNIKYEIIIYFKYITTKEKIAKLEIKEIQHFTGVSYLPLNIFSITVDFENTKHCNDAFCISDNTINIKYENFKVTSRFKKLRPVWIIKGESCLGKTYLSSIISNNSNLTIYETDTNEEIPNIIFQDIIVIGNKYSFSIEEIEKHIYGKHESIIINFSKQV